MHKVIRILITTSIFYNIVGGLFGPIYAIFVEKIGGDILTASGAWAVYSIVMGILLLSFGKIEDKVNKRKTVVIGYFFSSIGTTGYLFVSQPWHLFVVQIVLGLGVITNPAWDALFSVSVSKGKESSEWGLWEGSTRIYAGMAAIIGGFIASTFGFRMLFMLMSIAAISGFLVSCSLLRKKTWESFLKTYKLPKL